MSIGMIKVGYGHAAVPGAPFEDAWTGVYNIGGTVYTCQKVFYEKLRTHFTDPFKTHVSLLTYNWEVDKRRKEINKLSKEIEELNDSMAALRSELSTARASTYDTRTSLEKKLKDAESKLLSAETSCRVKDLTIKRLESELKDEKQQRELTKKELDASNEKLTESISEFTETAQKLEVETKKNKQLTKEKEEQDEIIKQNREEQKIMIKQHETSLKQIKADYEKESKEKWDELKNISDLCKTLQEERTRKAKRKEKENIGFYSEQSEQSDRSISEKFPLSRSESRESLSGNSSDSCSDVEDLKTGT